MSVNTWSSYTIMHKDRKVACIYRNGSCAIYDEDFMLYNLYLENTEGKPGKCSGHDWNI